MICDVIGKKHWIVILQFVFLLCFVYMLFKLFALGTPVALQLIGEKLESMPFMVVLIIFYGVGLFMFLLPPVPGVPVYVAAGSICVTRGLKEDGLTFYPAVIMVSLWALLIKLSAVVCQQKGFGEGLGSSVSIKMLVGVHTPTIRAIELILKRPGLSVGKVCILCGGPDWPTSVLTGILKLSLFQMLLGTLPCFGLIMPCVLAGAALSQPDMASMSPMFMMAAAASQGGMGIAAMLFIAREQERSYEILSKELPEHAELIQKSNEETIAGERLKRALAWKKVGIPQKAALLIACCIGWGICALATVAGTSCFRAYAIGTPLNASFVDGGLEGKTINVLVNPGGFACVGGLFFSLAVYYVYKTLNKFMLKMPPDTE
jgi:hypothetical protein